MNLTHVLRMVVFPGSTVAIVSALSRERPLGLRSLARCSNGFPLLRSPGLEEGQDLPFHIVVRKGDARVELYGDETVVSSPCYTDLSRIFGLHVEYFEFVRRAGTLRIRNL